MLSNLLKVSQGRVGGGASTARSSLLAKALDLGQRDVWRMDWASEGEKRAVPGVTGHVQCFQNRGRVGVGGLGWRRKETRGLGGDPSLIWS